MIMQVTMLGKTGIKVSKLSFGSVTVSPLLANLEVSLAADVIEEAFSLGVNFIDTAQLYKNYPHIRKMLDRLPDREKLIIATKAFPKEGVDFSEPIEEARRALNRDVIDIFLLHGEKDKNSLKEHQKALETLFTYKSKGLIKAVGISTHYVAGVYAAIEADLDVVHPIFNIDGLGIVDGSIKQMEEAIKAAKEKGLGIYAMKALGGGNLINKANESMSYAINHPYCDSVAVGMKTKEEVRANVSFFEKGKFSEEEMKNFKQKKLFIEDYCIGCGKCVNFCHQNALSLQNKKAACDSSKCLLCGYCSTVCPEFCIRIF